MMWRIAFLFSLLFFAPRWSLHAQPFYVQFQGATSQQNATLDSLAYQKKHQNTKSIQDLALQIEQQVQNKGYLFAVFSSPEKTNDSTFLYRIDLKERISHTVIDFQLLSEPVKALLRIQDTSIVLPIEQTSSYLTSLLQQLDKNGYAMSQAQLKDHKIKSLKMYANLDIELDMARKIDKITIQPYDNFPKGIKKQLQRKYIKKPFNQTTVEKAQEELTQFPFVRTTRNAEVLFTEAETNLYVYLEKNNVSRFDGLIGFSTDDQGKVSFNGNADLHLVNLFNKGEQFTIYWKSDGNQQSNFKFKTELPYVFQSPFGLKGGLDIFKQDSTQQNTKLQITALYYLSYNNRVGLGYQSTSSVAGNDNLFGAQNFHNQFVTANYAFQKYSTHLLFPLQTNIEALIGWGSRTQEEQKASQQQFLQLNLSHLIYLNDRNIIHAQLEGYHLFSDQVLFNELYRFGGVHSLRGFKENALLAQSLIGLYVEYRFLLSNAIYAHTITDYAYYQEPLSGFKGSLYSFGLGIGINTPGGLFNLIYANGIQPDTPFKLSNSILHLSFKTQF